MSYGIARIDDTITGTCTGQYQIYEQTGTTPIVTNPDGSTSGGDPIYGWVTYTENGTVSGTIATGSADFKVNGKGVARIGDNVNIIKTYPHNNHLDSLNVTGTISTGSNKYFANGKGIARIGDSVQADNCVITINSGSSNTLKDD